MFQNIICCSKVWSKCRNTNFSSHWRYFDGRVCKSSVYQFAVCISTLSVKIIATRSIQRTQTPPRLWPLTLAGQGNISYYNTAVVVHLVTWDWLFYQLGSHSCYHQYQMWYSKEILAICIWACTGYLSKFGCVYLRLSVCLWVWD